VTAADCPLCREDGGALVVRDELLRIVLVDDADYPGFARVIVNAHVREMTDLDAAALARVMAAVYAVEDALRAVLAPDKVNLASLGNVVPHLHWHVIPRFADDAHFPQPIWGARRREPDPVKLAARRARLPKLAEEIRARIGPR
jgi:diadenosine tetraphosphate (Ap4A) HIT family hydrolase